MGSNKIVIDFNKPLMNVTLQEQVMTEDGTKLTQKTQILSILGHQTTGDSAKHWEWMKEIVPEGILEVDKSDCEKLKELIDKDQRSFSYQKGQLLETITDAKSAKPAPQGAGSGGSRNGRNS